MELLNAVDGQRVFFEEMNGTLREMWIVKVPLDKRAKMVVLRSKPPDQDPCLIDRFPIDRVRTAPWWEELYRTQLALEWMRRTIERPTRMWPNRVKTILRWAKEDA